MSVLLLDLDTADDLHAYRGRRRWVLDTLQVTMVAEHIVRSPGGGGYHVQVHVQEPLDPVMVVTLQALLGSDYKREVFNLVRVRQLDYVPAFWQSRWNVLYSDKLQPRSVCRMIDPKEFGTSRPSLKAEALNGADTAVLTIQDVEVIEMTQDNEDRSKLILTFEEFPDLSYWVNVTGVKILVGQLGSNETKWRGKKVPLEVVKTTNPQTKKAVDALWVMDADEWDEVLSSPRRRSSRSAAKKTVTKRGRKK